MKRVMIIGGSGSGKSTLARRLGEKTGLPVIHCDQFQFRANWELVSDPERNERLDAAAQQDEWIMDGNYSATWPLRSKRADTIVFVDPPRYLRLWRILSRTARYHGKPRPDMPEGCNERFDWAFIKWTWSFDTKRRPAALNLIRSANNDKATAILKTIRETDEWLANCS